MALPSSGDLPIQPVRSSSGNVPIRLMTGWYATGELPSALMPITLGDNPVGDPVEGGFDLAAVRPALEAGNPGKFVDDPVPDQFRHELDLLDTGRRQPQPIDVTRRIAGPDHAVEDRLENFVGHPEVVADVGQPRHAEYPGIPVDSQHGPQPGHIESAIGP